MTATQLEATETGNKRSMCLRSGTRRGSMPERDCIFYRNNAVSSPLTCLVNVYRFAVLLRDIYKPNLMAYAVFPRSRDVNAV